MVALLCAFLVQAARQRSVRPSRRKALSGKLSQRARRVPQTRPQAARHARHLAHSRASPSS